MQSPFAGMDPYLESSGLWRNFHANLLIKIQDALATAQKGQPVIVDVRIDYSKRTRFTQGVVKTVLKRFPLGDKFRFIGRAFVRKVTG